MSISMGDIIVPVTVQLERTTPFGGDDRGIPFGEGDHNKGGDQTDPLGRQLARRINNFGEEVGDNESGRGT